MKALFFSDVVTLVGHGDVPVDGDGSAPDKVILGKSGVVFSNLALRGGTSALDPNSPFYQGPEYKVAYVQEGELTSVDAFEYFPDAISTQGV